MGNFRDICEKFDASVLQQLYKKITTEDNGVGNKDVFPVTLVQAVYDAISGIRLDDILSHYNYIYLEFKGSKKATRQAIPIGHRRNSLIISYKDYDNNTIVEQYIGENINDNEWQHDDNWKTPFTEGSFEISVTDSQLEKYINKYFEDNNLQQMIFDKADTTINAAIQQVIGEGKLDALITSVVNQFLNDRLGEYISEDIVRRIVREYCDELDLSNEINTIVNNKADSYFSSQDFKNTVNNLANTALNTYIGEHLSDAKIKQLVDAYLATLNLDDILNNKVEDKVNNYFSSDEFNTKIDEIVSNIAGDKINEYITNNLTPENLNEIITNAIKDNLNVALNNYFTTDEGKQAIKDAIGPELEEVVGSYFEAFNTYIQDNERVIANALARHEQAIIDLQNA